MTQLYPNEHPYAVAQEIERHDEAVRFFGEMTACVMLWNAFDFHAGLVGRCPTCYLNYGDIADAYKQAPRKNCPDCLGTTFAGGLRAVVYRPAIWTKDVVSQDTEKRGQVEIYTAEVQTVSGMAMREGDFLVRSNGTRWQINSPDDTEVATGFGPKGSDSVVGSFFRAQLEDESSVAYMIPISEEALALRGHSPYPLYPTQWDVINGDITDGGNDDPFSQRPPVQPPGNWGYQPPATIIMDGNDAALDLDGGGP